MFESHDQSSVFSSSTGSSTPSLSTQTAGLGSTHSGLVDPLQQPELISSSASSSNLSATTSIAGGNTLATATNIGNLEGRWINNGQVSSSDRNDYSGFLSDEVRAE
ncbi:hypothetical protein JOY44_19775 [Phormidium sp. CLA17]|uniref:hypothetical protein n=1 Tax=Leptolyngbya sp. Cla-17 TaxID=2803751 RepID=UPI0014922DFE|nr:hypothetical protein [Leptolyngbya sp. Cla-17]MBM0743830.1 hypothetical protein [Leptolyngbya sp. Cla-17]